MPSPGGCGGRGFGGGGRSGGGFSGGGRGFGGPHRHHHHGFHFAFWPRRRYYGYGYGGGLASIIIAPIIILLVASIVMITSVGSAITTVASGGRMVYDEGKIQEYGMERYAEVYGSAGAYEDNILIVFVVHEDCRAFNFISVSGNHINRNVKALYNGNAELYRVMSANVPEYYKYSLHEDLEAVIKDMSEKTARYSDRFDCTEDHNQTDPTLLNKSDLFVSSESITTALAAFEAETGITLSIVIADAEDVFGKTMPVIDIIVAIGALMAIIFGIRGIFNGIKARKTASTENKSENGDQYEAYNERKRPKF